MRKWKSDSYLTEIRRRPKRQWKIIVYEDEIVGLPEYEPNSTGGDQEEGDYEIQTKHQEPKRQVEKTKKVKKGITKSIKM